MPPAGNERPGTDNDSSRRLQAALSVLSRTVKPRYSRGDPALIRDVDAFYTGVERLLGEALPEGYRMREVRSPKRCGGGWSSALV